MNPQPTKILVCFAAVPFLLDLAIYKAPHDQASASAQSTGVQP